MAKLQRTADTWAKRCERFGVETLAHLRTQPGSQLSQLMLGRERIDDLLLRLAREQGVLIDLDSEASIATLQFSRRQILDALALEIHGQADGVSADSLALEFRTWLLQRLIAYITDRL